MHRRSDQGTHRHIYIQTQAHLERQHVLLGALAVAHHVGAHALLPADAAQRAGGVAANASSVPSRRSVLSQLECAPRAYDDSSPGSAPMRAFTQGRTARSPARCRRGFVSAAL
eukprot:TRINITY_DN3488_c0_g2_i1.p1 TRINITY_DN3488_c0_g2~~TRINITY_DN3488_c0_g2_i1.p1  ORF type:complete len:113 (+),score=7.47 TRINITY_DN3488_c0_g2_i1:412-750(+)